jgi:hypothetical protein
VPYFSIAAFWTARDGRPLEFSILTVSAALLVSAIVRNLKILLLGTDYSDRLFTTIFANFVVVIALGLYLGVKRSWLAAVAAALLALGWLLLLWAINSVV